MFLAQRKIVPFNKKKFFFKQFWIKLAQKKNQKDETLVPSTFIII